MSKENRVSDERTEMRVLLGKINAGRKVLQGDDTGEIFVSVEAALDAMLSLRSKPVAGVEVKSLEWEMGEAKSAVGLYSVHRYEAPSPKWSVRLDGNALQLYADAEVGARSLAQSHLEEIILSAISLPAQEPVAWRAFDPADGEWALFKRDPRPQWECGPVVPLYASPQPEAVTTEEMAERVWLAVLDCPHTITGQEIILRHAAEKEGRNATNQLRERITAALKEA